MRLYIDTSVINGLYADDAPWIKSSSQIFFKNAKSKGYKLFVSDLVLAEIERTANKSRREKLLSVISKYKFDIIIVDNGIEKLANEYVKQNIIPSKYLPDALHIALATVYRIPVVVSWNFKHMVKHNTRIMVNETNKKLEHIEIDICSPEEID
jgi:predicted nucleic acid-binding protein